MANITPYVNEILAARYGEQVRGSIASALTAMNDDITDDTASAATYAASAAESAQNADVTATGMADTLTQIEADLSVFASAENERETAEAARASAETARAAAETARENAETGYVAQARQYAAQAQQYASSDNAMLSQSWAVGGTGTRYQEDTNNSKYWCEQAAYIVSEGGVASFNGRAGVVVPENGDYSASQITRGTGTVDSSLSALESNIDTKVDKTTPLLNLDTAAASSTVDGQLTAALTALGWLNDVIVS